MRIINCVGSSKAAEDAYKLRYEIYSSELNYNDNSFNHECGIYTDIFDEKSSIYIAYDDENEAVASIRFFKLSDQDEHVFLDQEISDLLSIDKFPSDYHKHIYVGSRFVVKPNKRSTLVTIRLLERAFLEKLEEGGKFVLTYCDPYLIDMYSKLGFYVYGSPMVDNNGYITPLILLKDWTHLKSVRYPLFRAAEKAGFVNYCDGSVEWFHNVFSDEISKSNVSLSIDGIVNSLSEAICSTVLYEQSPMILSGFCEEEIAMFLSFCKIIKCGADQLFIKSDQRTEKCL